MNIRLSFACAGVLALALPSFAAATPAGPRSDQSQAAAPGIVLAQIQAPPGGQGAGQPDQRGRGGGQPGTRGGGGGGGGGPPAVGGGGGTAGGGGGRGAVQREGGGGGGFQRGGGGGGGDIQRGGRGGARIGEGGGRGGATIDSRSERRFDRGGRDFGRRRDFRGDDVRVRSRVGVRDNWRRDRYRYRDRGPRVGVYLGGGRRSCHRHTWRYRVLRHCHRYGYRFHRHGRWR